MDDGSVFEIGKYYQHSMGRRISILCWAETYFHGRCMIAEESDGCFTPVGADEANAVNWEEISREQWVVPSNPITDAIPAILNPATAYRERADLLYYLLANLNAMSDATDLVQQLSDAYGYDSAYEGDSDGG